MSKAFLYALLCFACGAAAQVDPAIVEKLREGGLVLYMRHTSTDFSQNDAAMTTYADCVHQRNLTEKGRAEAREIGAHLKRLAIPVGQVLASPFCRTMETARLVFGDAQAMNEVRGGPAQPDDPRRYDALRKLLSTPVAKGENRIISSHGNPFHAVAGPPYLAEGEIAVVRPEGAMRFSVIARIRPQDWSDLRADAGRASWAGP
ncbi:MAG: histidine phosphatase family protein [Burkholderiales bacterium]